MNTGDTLTEDFLVKLILKLQQSTVTNKQQLIRDLYKTLDAVKLTNRLGRNPLKFQPGSVVFLAVNRLSINSVDVDVAE